jgi:hypothetical protein
VLARKKYLRSSMPSLFAPNLENSYQQSLCCVLCESICTFQLREEYILENGRDNTSSTSRMSNFDVFLKRRIRKDNAETFFPLGLVLRLYNAFGICLCLLSHTIKNPRRSMTQHKLTYVVCFVTQVHMSCPYCKTIKTVNRV